MPQEMQQQMNEMMKALKENAHLMLDDKTAPIYFVLQQINENLAKMASKEAPQAPETVEMKLPGVELVTIKGEPGKDGETPTDEHLIELITPLIPDPIPGKDGQNGRNGVDGRTPIKDVDYFDGEPGRPGENGKDGSPDTPEQVKEKLLQVGLTIEDISGLSEVIEEVKKKAGSRPMFGGGFNVSALNIHHIDNELVGTGDDVTTQFSLDNLPSPANSLHLYVGGNRMFEGASEDYTIVGTAITFLTAPPTGAKIRATYRV